MLRKYVTDLQRSVETWIAHCRNMEDVRDLGDLFIDSGRDTHSIRVIFAPGIVQAHANSSDIAITKAVP